jgi:hypothetical protein
MSAMVSRPGIDPRIWCVPAVVTGLGFDAEEGVFADVQFVSDGTKETALLGTPYSVDGGGLYCPVEIGDIVYVMVPMGDPAFGCVIVSRGWRKGSRPPPEAGVGDEPSENLTWRIKDSKTLTIFTKDGEVNVKSTGSGTVSITSAGAVTVQSDATVTINGTSKVDVKSASKVNVEAPAVTLGPLATAAVARLGDTVSVTVPTGIPVTVSTGTGVGTTTAPITATGTITSGQPAVKA